MGLLSTISRIRDTTRQRESLVNTVGLQRTFGPEADRCSLPSRNVRLDRTPECRDTALLGAQATGPHVAPDIASLALTFVVMSALNVTLDYFLRDASLYLSSRWMLTPVVLPMQSGRQC